MNAPLDYFHYQNGFLASGGISLSQIAETFGTPVYVYSADSFRQRFHSLKKGLEGLDHLICFAMKSNSNLEILKLLAHESAGMDVVSEGEMRRAFSAGVSPEKIIFSGVGKTPEEMKNGLTLGGKGIFSFNIESIQELKVLNQVAQGLGLKAPVALRFNPDVDPKTHPYISTGIKKNKFGMTLDEIWECAQLIRSMPGIELCGLSIHIGSQLISLSPLEDAFGRLSGLVQKLISEMSYSLRFVDLGGGLGISYRLDEDPKSASPDVGSYCRLIHRFFGVQSAFHGRLKIVLEPGRYISGNSGVLITKVLYRKKRKSKDFLVVDAAMTDLIRPALYDGFHEIIPINEAYGNGKTKATNVVGPVCESSDFLGKSRPLSLELSMGDYLAVLSAGAYGFSMASQYNSRPRPPEILIEDSNYRLIRRRETFEDLIAAEKPVVRPLG